MNQYPVRESRSIEALAMTDRPIEQSEDTDLRSLDAALQRAAQSARERARATGTRLVLSENGALVFFPSESLVPGSEKVAERTTHYAEYE